MFYTNHRISLTGKSGVRSDSCLSHSGHEAWLQRHDLRNHGPATCRFAAAWRCFEQRKFQLRISFALFKTRNQLCWQLPILFPVMSCSRRTVVMFSSSAVTGPSRSAVTGPSMPQSFQERRQVRVFPLMRRPLWRRRGWCPPGRLLDYFQGRMDGSAGATVGRPGRVPPTSRVPEAFALQVVLGRVSLEAVVAGGVERGALAGID